MVFQKPVLAAVLGQQGDGLVHIGLTVLPMGWHSAVGLMQAAHREIALRSQVRGGAGLLEKCEIKQNAEFPEVEELSLLVDLPR